MCCVVFFFKQRTAYELRISDWSSDVCSSDLRPDLATLSDEASERLSHPVDERLRRKKAGACSPASVAVVGRLERPLLGHADIGGLLGRELGDRKSVV